MPIQVEQLPGEPIICASVEEPFEPQKDVPAMFQRYIALRQSINGPAALIFDFKNAHDAPNAFTRIMYALAEAAKGIRASKQAQTSGPPILIFVGDGYSASMVTQAIEQRQYGGRQAYLCTTQEEALALAREQLSAPP